MMDLAFVLNNRVLVLSEIFLFLNTGYNFTKVTFTFLIRVWISSKAPPYIVAMLPRYGKDLSVSPMYHLLAIPDMHHT